MGPNHTDDSGGWNRTDLNHRLTTDLEAHRTLVTDLNTRPDATDTQRLVALVELQLHEDIARMVAPHLGGPQPPLVLLHAMRCAGPSTVWAPLGDGREVLARVAGNVHDQAQQYAVYQHLLTADGLPTRAVCGYSVQQMPTGLLGYVDSGQRHIVIADALSDSERRRTRTSLAAALAARRRGRRPRLLALVAPLPLLLAGLREAIRNLAGSTGVATSTLAATATLATVAAVSVTPMPSTVTDTPPVVRQIGRSLPVAQTVPSPGLRDGGGRPRPATSSAPDAAAAVPSTPPVTVSASPVADVTPKTSRSADPSPSPSSGSATPSPEPTPAPSEDPAPPEAAPDPGPGSGEDPPGLTATSVPGPPGTDYSAD